MAGTREDREQELQKVWTSDCIGLVRIYQAAIGTPQGQVSIPDPHASAVPVAAGESRHPAMTGR